MADTKDQAEAYTQESIDDSKHDTVTQAPAPDNAFHGVVANPPEVEVDSTGTPHRKGSAAGKWSDKDEVKEDK